MATFVFDTHRAVKNLEEAGFAEAQAEALVEIVGSAVGENVATKANLDAMERRTVSRFEALEQSTTTRFEALEQKMTARFEAMATQYAALEQKLDFEIRSVRSDMRNMENRIVLKLGGVILATGALVFAALRYIPV